MVNGLLLICAMTMNANQSPWSTQYGPALRAAQKAKRPLIVVLDPVKSKKKTSAQLSSTRKSSTGKKTSAKTSTAQGLLNQFELCHIDVTSEYGRRMAKVFKAKKFPHTAIIDKSGKHIIYRKTGRFTMTQWKKTLETYKKGVRPVSARRRSNQTMQVAKIANRAQSAARVQRPQNGAQPIYNNAQTSFGATLNYNATFGNSFFESGGAACFS